MDAIVRINLAPLKKLVSNLHSRPMSDRVRKKIAARYAAFTAHWITSGGNGTWPPLSSATLTSRRGSNARIMRDTGILLRAAMIGARGNYYRAIPHGIRYGFSTAMHSSGKTVAQIVRYHQFGEGRNPKRLILVHPDNATIRMMQKDWAQDLPNRGKRYKGRIL